VWGPPDEEGNYKIRALADLGGLQSFAYGVSADGSVVVGYSEDRSRHLKAVRWVTDWPEQLGTLGGAQSAAYGVSADGSVIVGWAERADGIVEPFRWQGGTIVGLGMLPGDWQETKANAVSAHGSVVVGYAQNREPGGSLTFEPFIWDQAHGIRSLTELLTQNGIDLSDWDLNTAVDISADGRVIVGNGYHISAARQEAWIATIPEPSSLTLLTTLAAALLLARFCRKRKR
jgi:probable HAF family extracellular repeat protein